MKNLSNFRPTHWLMLIFANLLIVLSCSKDKNESEVSAPQVETPAHLKDREPQPKVDVKQPYVSLQSNTPYIQFTTEKTESISLNISASAEDKKDVWIDLNGNGKWDEGTDTKVTTFNERVSYPIKAQTIRVYGKVFNIDLTNQQISTLELHNPVLQFLGAGGNSLKSLSIPDSDALTGISLSANFELKSLTLGNLQNLELLDINGTDLNTLNLNGYKNLKYLYIIDVPLTALDLSTQTKLKEIHITIINGKGLIGEPLKAFAKSLHSNGGGVIGLSKEQYDQIGNILQNKNWEVKGGVPQRR